MNTQEITEEQVVQWLQAQREKHGLNAMQFTVHAPIEARKEHGPIKPFYSVAAHTKDECKVGDSLAHAVNQLTKQP